MFWNCIREMVGNRSARERKRGTILLLVCCLKPYPQGCWYVLMSNIIVASKSFDNTEEVFVTWRYWCYFAVRSVPNNHTLEYYKYEKTEPSGLWRWYADMILMYKRTNWKGRVAAALCSQTKPNSSPSHDLCECLLRITWNVASANIESLHGVF